MSFSCIVCGQEVPVERVEALGLTEASATCVKHSVSSRKKGLFAGLVGVSEFLIVDKVYNDSVRGVFKRSLADSELSESIADGTPTQETEADDETTESSEAAYYSAEEQSDPSEKVEIVKRQDA